MRTIKSIITVSIVLVLVSACRRNEETIDASQTAQATMAADMYDDVQQVVEDAAESNGLSGKTDETNQGNLCATVTLSPNDKTTFPKEMVIDFSNGCTGPTGRQRQGKVTVLMTGKLREPGATASITFTDYVVAGNKINGTYSLTNNTATSKVVTATIQSGSIETTSGKTITWNGTKTVEQIAGSGNLVFSDNVYLVDGAFTGVLTDGTTVSSNSADVRVEGGCKYITSGTTTLHFGGQTIPYVLDYGDGSCDNKAVVAKGNVSKDIIFAY